MWHSANRATRASGRFFISVCLPFPLAGRPFHRFAPGILDNLACVIGICTGGRFVSAPLPGFSPYVLADVAILRVGRSFLKPSNVRLESHTPTRQPNIDCTLQRNKNFGRSALLNPRARASPQSRLFPLNCVIEEPVIQNAETIHKDTQKSSEVDLAEIPRARAKTNTLFLILSLTLRYRSGLTKWFLLWFCVICNTLYKYKRE